MWHFDVRRLGSPTLGLLFRTNLEKNGFVKDSHGCPKSSKQTKKVACLPPPGPIRNPPQAWSSSGCTALGVSPLLPGWGLSGPVWRAGWGVRTLRWLCFLHTAWWGSLSPPATTAIREDSRLWSPKRGLHCAALPMSWEYYLFQGSQSWNWLDSSGPASSLGDTSFKHLFLDPQPLVQRIS